MNQSQIQSKQIVIIQNQRFTMDDCLRRLCKYEIGAAVVFEQAIRHGILQNAALAFRLYCDDRIRIFRIRLPYSRSVFRL